MILDYYFSLVRIGFPEEHDSALNDPRFGGGPVKEPKKVKQRKGSVDTEVTKEHRKKERRRSRDRTPPPTAPMPGHHRR